MGKHGGDRTLKYITNVKPALMKLLQQRFGELNKPAKNARKHAHSAQGLPAVRGKRKQAMPARQAVSQPVRGAGFFHQQQTAEDVLRDAPELLSMGDQFQQSPGNGVVAS